MNWKLPDRENFEKFWIVFEALVEIRLINSISLIVQALWIVREVEAYALSKFQLPTTLGDPQNVEKTIRKKFDFLVSRNVPQQKTGSSEIKNALPDSFPASRAKINN